MDTEKIVEILIAAVFSFTIGASLKFIKPKSKLVIWFPHNFLFQEVEPGVNLHTQTYTIQNLGSDNAKIIDIVHRRRPDFFRLQPQLDYVEKTATGSEHIISINTLAPKEFFSLEILSYRNLPEFLYVRSNDGYAKPITFSLQRVLPKWAQYLLRLILGMGFATILYGIYWLSNKAILLLLNQ